VWCSWDDEHVHVFPDTPDERKAST
jgi:hypothetical protein